MPVRSLARYIAIGAAGAALIYAFWLTRPQWDPEMRLWKAVGDASLLLLYTTISIGPVARLWPQSAQVVLIRREVGVWFGLLALVHTFLILDGWARWDVTRFLGYEFIPELGRLVRWEPGFGLANILGLVAIFITLPLIATSSDWAMRKLGGSAWKFLHNATYVIFWLVVLHTGYFLFLHYTAHFHRAPPPPDWARFPFAGLTLAVIGLQSLAFVATVRRRSRQAARRSQGAVADLEDSDQAWAAAPVSRTAGPRTAAGSDAGNDNSQPSATETRSRKMAARKRR